MSQSPDRDLSQDVVFDLLSSSRRRFVLYYLRQRDEPVELGDLASELAAWENDTAVDDLTDRQRKRVYVSLYQTHIPKLEDAGLVSYDSETGSVRLLSRIDEFSRYLATDDDEFPWQLYYLVLTIAGLAFYLAVWIGVLGLISETVAAVVIIAVFGLSAAVHYVVERQSEWRLPLSYRRGE